MQLVRQAYPDATNVEADAVACGQGRTRTGGRRVGYFKTSQLGKAFFSPATPASVIWV